ncbi:hypothetical protein SKAU_G00048910 [Synaphobranchus kaupii]|uniref:5-hydroxytryptamine receptor 2B n=1 Tax=Synaphobranchus kaupii TaxID=118154 RepID=A0A9Q1J8G2_SYNKA|nr:hypothetical protein SKAU_G00048910 [Synaphobranchus kaupii]
MAYLDSLMGRRALFGSAVHKQAEGLMLSRTASPTSAQTTQPNQPGARHHGNPTPLLSPLNPLKTRDELRRREQMRNSSCPHQRRPTAQSLPVFPLGPSANSSRVRRSVPRAPRTFRQGTVPLAATLTTGAVAPEFQEGNGSSPENTTAYGDGGGELRWSSLLIVPLIIPTIGGNILVILAVALERKLQNATNYFLMSLAVADLLVGLLVMPIALVTVLFNSGWPLPGYLCPIWLFLDVLFSTASIMHLCAISLDRYIAIKRPIQHSQYKSRSKALAKITVVWLISIGIATPIPIIGLRNFHFPNDVTFINSTCVLKQESFREFIKFGSLVAFFIPLTIMMVIYLLTIQVLRKKACLLRFKASQRTGRLDVATVFQTKLGAADDSPETEPAPEGSRKDKPPNHHLASASGEEIPIRRMSTMGKKSMQNLSNEQRASKVLGIVFLLFVVMWCPFFITNVTSALCDSGCDSKVVTRLMEIFVWVGYVSSGINPLVYTLFNKTFREAFTRYITCNYSGTAAPTELQRKNTATARISFRSSVAENSKLFMKRGMSNGIGAAGYQSPLRRRPNTTADSPAPDSTSMLLDTLLLTENQNHKHEECVSYV